MKKTKNFYSIAIIFCIIIFAALIVAVGMLTRPDNHSATKFTEHFNRNLNKLVYLNTVRNVFYEAGFNSRVDRKETYISKVNKMKRFAYGKANHK